MLKFTHSNYPKGSLKMAQAHYIPLRIHSEFSIIDGTIRLKELAQTAAKFGLPALGFD